MYEIVYNSDVIIDEPGILESLCIFYDRLILPNASSKNYFSVCLSKKSGEYIVASTNIEQNQRYTTQGMKFAGQVIEEWDSTHAALFKEGIIRRLKTPPNVTYAPSFRSNKKDNVKFLELLFNSPIFLNMLSEGDFIRQATLEHLLRTDISLPAIFLNRTQADTRKIFTTIEAKCVFSYFIPKIDRLNIDQILEVRRKVADNREGFLMHLQRLSKEVESRVKENAPLDEISHNARSIIETDLIPDYIEFRRQLESEKAGFWKKVLDRSSKVLEIDAAPWTPKFWTDIIRYLAMTGIDAASSRKDLLTNKSQAFHFMKKIEDFSSRIKHG